MSTDQTMSALLSTPWGFKKTWRQVFKTQVFPSTLFYLWKTWLNHFSCKWMEELNFVCSYLLNELSYWPQFGLILKSWQSSLKWAQVEVSSSIRLGATVFQSWCYFLNNGKDPYNFVSSYLLNELSKRAQSRLILKSWQSSSKWAQVEVSSSIRFGATVFQSWWYFVIDHFCHL